MAIRGTAQADVQRRYVEVHDMAVRFLLERSDRVPAGSIRFAEWLSAQRGPRTSVTVRTGTEPAPTVVRVLETVDAQTLTTLRDARHRDPAAPLFEAQNLSRVVSKAIAGDLESALGLVDFALAVHPSAPILHALKSQILEARGDLARRQADRHGLRSDAGRQRLACVGGHQPVQRPRPTAAMTAIRPAAARWSRSSSP